MNNIRDNREKLGITQEVLARRMKVERSTVAKWEAGESLPRADKLPDLANLFGCTVDELLRKQINQGDM